MVSGLMTLGAEYRSMLTRAVMAEEQNAEIMDLLVSFFAENDKGAETFLREVAADWAEQFVRRRADGKAAA